MFLVLCTYKGRVGGLHLEELNGVLLILYITVCTSNVIMIYVELFHFLTSHGKEEG